MHKIIGHSPFDRINKEPLIIISEYMEKGSLSKLLETEPNITYRRRLAIALDVVCGMARIHDLVIRKIFLPQNKFKQK